MLKEYISKLHDLNEKPEKVRALSLFSGGLDSVLAAYLVAQQGIEVICLHFDTGFLTGDHKRLVKDWAENYPDLRFEYIDVSNEYLDVLRNPKYGYGSSANPCIDCHLFMIRQAVKMLEEFEAHLVITGEVRGQRPKSQNLRAMQKIKEQSEIEGFLLRPLSAKLLDETIPEQKGWIDRDQLLDIHGRSRERQMQLAKDFELNVLSKPGNDACNLLESPFSVRFFDFIMHNEQKEPSKNDYDLLKFGRHFRISPSAKLVVGRNLSENEALLSMKDMHYVIKAEKYPGPIALLELNQNLTESEMKIAASIVVRYSKAPKNEDVEVFCEFEDETKMFVVEALEREKIFDYSLVGVPKNRPKNYQIPNATRNSKLYKGKIN